MNIRWLDYLYIAATIIFTVYGQLILKWRIAHYGVLPINLFEKLKFLLGLLLDPLILSGFFAAFLASLAWMAAMTKFQLSQAYPFMALNFVIVLLLSAGFLGEPLTLIKIIGVLFVMLGIFLAVQ